MGEPLDILKQYWGFEQFRQPQEEIIQSVLEGQDTLALMPTGGGKSICFQVPALAREGICIVISPLIALMNDQVQRLQQLNIPAVAIHSGLHYRDIDRLLDNCIYGNTKLLYLSPERLKSDLARERIRQMKVNLLAVDEAHCISQWGYDFRPAYLEIAAAREWLPDVPVLALTATATPEVVNDIQEQLQFSKPHVFQKSFERNNLAYVVLYEEGKINKLLDILRKVAGTGIVYVRNRRKTKDIALMLQRNGIRADFYHAGLEPQVRSEKQAAWLAGRIRVMVCTNAFGMGIDKANVRTVVHMELPDSLEAYFQEAGRAGRDGQRSYAILLYQDSDRQNLERQYKNAYPPMEEIRQVYRALGSYYQLALGAGPGQSYDFDIIKFTQTYQLDLIKTFNALRLLEQAGWILLTEAVYQPASLMIKVSKDELYDYQIRHSKLDRVLKAVLRSYQGAFSHRLNIRETQLAKLLKWPRTELQQAFEKMNQDKVIDYRPPKDKPQLLFLQDRIDADNLSIDQQRYHFRKTRHQERIQAAIAYAVMKKCRSQQLLNYFGEKDSPLCGICDMCTGRNTTELTSEDYEKLKRKIQQVLIRESLKPEQVINSFSPRWQERVIKTLEFLLDEGMVRKEEEKLVWEG